MSHILLTGIVTLDIIHYLEHYPQEDTEQRASQQFFETGGNTANSSYILKQLGHEPKLAATLADDPASHFICDQLQQRGIGWFEHFRNRHSQSPTSCITINQQNGSRTISHYRDLDELSIKQFNTIDLHAFDWLHFEGRNIQELKAILDSLNQRPHPPISLEAEKPREGMENLFGHADIIFLSKTYAGHMGFDNAPRCLAHFARHYPEKLLICAWGEQGAWAMDAGQLYHSRAYPPEQLIDTRAAGDTFNAACIHSLLQHEPAARMLESACRLAGKKCGQHGLTNLV